MINELPNFLIVGAGKCGTTSLHYYLNQHPEIVMSKTKETHFFIQPKLVLGKQIDKVNVELIDDFNVYKKLFISDKNAKAIGETTPTYLYFNKQVIPNIKKYLGDPKIIIIVRNPIERAFSNYLHQIRDGFETLSFEKAIKEEKEGKRENEWFSYKLLGKSMYSEQIKAYQNNFSKVKVFKYEDMKNNFNFFFSEIIKFLEVDTNFIPEVKTVYNKTGIPKSRFLKDFIEKPNIFKNFFKKIIGLFSPDIEKTIIEYAQKIFEKNLIKPEINKETYNELVDYFKEDILKTEKLINKDLSLWLRKK